MDVEERRGLFLHKVHEAESAVRTDKLFLLPELLDEIRDHALPLGFPQPIEWRHELETGVRPDGHVIEKIVNTMFRPRRSPIKNCRQPISC